MKKHFFAFCIALCISMPAPAFAFGGVVKDTAAVVFVLFEIVANGIYHAIRDDDKKDQDLEVKPKEDPVQYPDKPPVEENNATTISRSSAD